VGAPLQTDGSGGCSSTLRGQAVAGSSHPRQLLTPLPRESPEAGHLQPCSLSCQHCCLPGHRLQPTALGLGQQRRAKV